MKRALILAAALVLISGVAFAAPTFQANDVTVFGNLRVVFGQMAFDSSYPTGGEGATRSQLSVGRITNSTAMVQVPSESGYLFEYDYTNAKVKVYNGGGATVAAHTHSVTTSGHTHTITVTDSTAGTALKFAGGTVYADGATDSITTASATDTSTTGSGGAITAATATEVANGTDLSALTAVRYVIYGR